MLRTIYFTQLLVHIPYVVWLMKWEFAAMRSLMVVVALGLLGRRFLVGPLGALQYPGTLCLCISSVLGFLGFWSPFFWAVSVPCGVLGCVLLTAPRQAKPAQYFFGPRGILVILGAASFPYELYAGGIDPWLQHITAWLAAPLIRITGLGVALDDPFGFVLVGDQLVVTVTALCAGVQTFLSLGTLAMVIAVVWIDTKTAQMTIILMTPVLGFFGNVLRVAISTHAARWLGGGAAWTVAHDVIGYGVFGVLYGLLFFWAKRLSQKSIKA